MGFIDRLQHGWNAFINNRDPTYISGGSGYSYVRPDRTHLSVGTEKTIINAIYNRMALDAAAILIQHCKLDENERFLEVIPSKFNDCLTLSANIDQTGRAFRHDLFLSMLEEGCVAAVPVDTTLNPKVTGSYDIESIRTGKVMEWFPEDIRVNVYNERTGKKEDIKLPKKMVSIIENPFYSVMNAPNSTLQRLKRKLAILDAIDEQSGSGKLDLIIQVPFVVKSETRRQQAEKRRSDIEDQLSNSKYGVAYTDGTERIIQLNRPIENKLLSQIEYLTNLLYSQLGITQSIMDGTADEATMLNYYSRTIEPMVSAVVDEMKRKFLTKTARTKGQSILFFRDPFKLVPIANMADIADKFTRNEILSSNEIRQIVGFKPSSDPKADQLINSNLNHPEEGVEPMDPYAEDPSVGAEDSGPDLFNMPISSLSN